MKILSYNSWLAQHRIWRVLFVIIMVAMVIYEGGRPGNAPDGSENWVVSYCSNLAHQPLFGLVALSFLLALGKKCRTPQAYLLGVTFALLVGIGDELHQATIPFRYSSIWDVGSDVLGATFAILVAGWSDLRGGVFAHLLPMAGLFVLSLLWNLLPSFAYSYPLPF
jgi:VanZ family protein